MTTRDDLLAAYDAQLREGAEVAGLAEVSVHGPLWVARPVPERGFVTYRSLAGLDAAALDALVGEVVAALRATPGLVEVEWKARGHDALPDLDGVLVSYGFVRRPTETVMAGEALALTGHDQVPGVTVRAAGDGADLRSDVARAVALQEQVFDQVVPGMVDLTMDRLVDTHVQLWLAEAGGEVVGTGRLELVARTEFAGLYGGAVRADWRGRGVYRALTQARAAAAVAADTAYLYADCTEWSWPILRRCGLTAVTTTVPYALRLHPGPLDPSTTGAHGTAGG